MWEALKKPRPVLWGIALGLILGISQGYSASNIAGMAIQTPPLFVFPFGVLAPPLLVAIQLPLLRRGKPRWHHFLNRYLNMLVFVSFYGLSVAVTYMVRTGTFDPTEWRADVAFFGSIGLGCLLAALIEGRWGQPRAVQQDGGS